MRGGKVELKLIGPPDLSHPRDWQKCRWWASHWEVSYWRVMWTRAALREGREYPSHIQRAWILEWNTRKAQTNLPGWALRPSSHGPIPNIGAWRSAGVGAPVAGTSWWHAWAIPGNCRWESTGKVNFQNSNFSSDISNKFANPLVPQTVGSTRQEGHCPGRWGKQPGQHRVQRLRLKLPYPQIQKP